MQTPVSVWCEISVWLRFRKIWLESCQAQMIRAPCALKDLEEFRSLWPCGRKDWWGVRVGAGEPGRCRPHWSRPAMAAVVDQVGAKDGEEVGGLKILRKENG